MQIDLKTLFGQTGELEEKFVLTILKAFKTQSGSTFDYLKFKQSVRALEDLNLEESIRLKSAFSTAQTMGLSKEKLLQSIQSYLNVLQKEQNQFSIALKNQIDNKVKTTEDRKVKYQKEADAIDQKIEKLKRDKLEYLEAVKTLDQQILATSEKIDETRKQFIKTYDYFKGVIEEDMNKVSAEL